MSTPDQMQVQVQENAEKEIHNLTIRVEADGRFKLYNSNNYPIWAHCIPGKKDLNTLTREAVEAMRTLTDGYHTVHLRVIRPDEADKTVVIDFTEEHPAGLIRERLNEALKN